MESSPSSTQGFSLSPQQRRLWRLAPRAEGSAFRSEAVAAWTGDVDAGALRAAIGRVVDRHEILRTTFVSLPGLEVPVQVVAERGELALECRPAAAGRLEDVIDEALAALASPPLDPARGPIAHLSLTPLATSEHLLCVRLSALCGDGASAALLLREIGDEYLGTGAGETERAQYADVAELFNDLLVSEETRQGREHWARLDPDAWDSIEVPWARRSAGEERFDPRRARLALPAGIRSRIAALCSRSGADDASFWLACWAALIARLSDRRTVSLGVAFDGRTYEELEGALGAFARVLPMTFAVDGNEPFHGLLAAVEGARVAAAGLQDYFAWDHFEAGASTPAFAPLGFRREIFPAPGAGEVRIVDQRAYPERFLLELTVSGPRQVGPRQVGPRQAGPRQAGPRQAGPRQAGPRQAGGDVALQYDAARFDRDDAGRLAEHFENLVASALEEPGAAVGDLDLLGPGERRRLLVDLNRTGREFPARCLHRYFEATAERVRDRVAVSAGGAELTYGELEGRANALAYRLEASGVRAGDPVGICLDPGADLAVAVLATLKAGGAWVPLEPGYPAERLRWMVADTGSRRVVTTRSLGDRFVGMDAEILYLDRDRPGRDKTHRDGTAAGASLDHAAYVIYTSGSSGRPKGVVMPHRGIVNRLLWMRSAYPAGSGDRVLWKTPFSFDASIWELFLPFFDGARLEVARPGGHRDAAYLAEVVRSRRITVLQLVPSMFRVWVEEPDAGRCTSLRRVFCGGEALPRDPARRFSERLPAELYNLYGPTEVAIDATCQPCAELGRRPSAPIVPIGRPLANVEVYVLDRRGQPVPARVAGELSVGGAGVARGYLGRPGLTAERFVPDPWSARSGARLYRTGDRVVQRTDGVLEFLGRVDDQVKIRGFRIELGEIEARLGEHPGVRQAAVAVRDDASSHGQLAAYVVAAGSSPPGGDELRAFLRARLPEFMVPAAFVALETLPLLANGKVDRRALPDAGPDVAVATVAPRTPIEEILEGIWSDVLGVPRAGVHQDFFALGGHSLTAIQAVSRVRRAFGVELDVKTLFESSTVAELAAEIARRDDRGGSRSRPPIRPVPRDRKLPLSLIQQQLWLFDQLQPDSLAYNIAVVLGLDGRLDVPALERSMSEIVRRHEVLRTRFRHQGSTVWQEIDPPGPAALSRADLRSLSESARPAAAREVAAGVAKRPFDLARGPLLRLLLVHLGDRRQALLLIVHHIVSDAWSMQVLTREFSVLYEAFRQRRPSPLPPLEIQYADYACWQRGWLRGEVLEDQLDFWKRELADLPGPLAPEAGNRLWDKPRPAQQRFRGGRQVRRLSGDTVTSLRELCRREGATLFMTSLAAFQFFLAHYSGRDDLVVGSPIIVRNHVEVEGLIGCFANLLPMRADLSDDPGFRRHLARVRRRTLDAHAHQEVSLGLILDALGIERDLGRNPLVQVGFALHEVSMDDLELAELSVTPDPFDVDRSWVQFDLAMNVVLRAEGVDVGLSYSTDLFEPSTIASCLESFEELLRMLDEAPDARRSEVGERLDEADAKRRQARRQQARATRLEKFEKLRHRSARSRPSDQAAR